MILGYSNEEWFGFPFDMKNEIIESKKSLLFIRLDNAKSKSKKVLESKYDDESLDESLINIMLELTNKTTETVSINDLKTFFNDFIDEFNRFICDIVVRLKDDSNKIPQYLNFSIMNSSLNEYLTNGENSDLSKILDSIGDDGERIIAFDKFFEFILIHEIYKKRSGIILGFNDSSKQIQYLEEQFVYIIKYGSLGSFDVESKVEGLRDMANRLEGDARDFWYSLCEKYKDQEPCCQELLSIREKDQVTSDKVGRIGVNNIDPAGIESASSVIKKAVKEVTTGEIQAED